MKTNPLNTFVLFATLGFLLLVSAGNLVIHQVQAVPTPAGITYSVPITLTNTQSVATPAPFQQMIVMNSAVHGSYEASNLQNVEFYDSDGAVVPSWLESGNTNTATNTVYWLSIANGIPAASTIKVYMGFASTSTNLFNTQTTGEAPELSPVYGQYDTGPFVFPALYQNFAGSGVPSDWNAIGSIVINNQLQIPASAGALSYIQTNSNYGLDPSQVLDFYGSANTASLSDASNIAGGYSISPPTDHGFVGFQFNGPLGGTGTGDSANGIGGNIAYLTDGTNDVLTIYASSSSSSSFQNNYVQTDTIPAGLSSPSPVFFSTRGGNSGTLTVYWVRLRSYPPNGVMPTVVANGQTFLPGSPTSESPPLILVGVVVVIVIMVVVGLLSFRKRKPKRESAAAKGSGTTVVASSSPTTVIRPAQAPMAVSSAALDKLQRLKEMLDKGLITQQDYDEQKKEILGNA